ncbi:dimethylarginine dimethylaminohydrolase family protein [Spirosoma koreense]
MVLNIQSEMAPLKRVIVGIGTEYPLNQNNPVCTYHLEQGTFPRANDLTAEMDYLAEMLEQLGIIVHRPTNLSGVGQLFTRDIGFVIDDYFVRANMKLTTRQAEYTGITDLLATIPAEKLLIPPLDSTLEGGDVIVGKDRCYVGVGNRTNPAGLTYLQQQFPHRQIIGLPIIQSSDRYTNIVHLDCAFNPVGHRSALLYRPGFHQLPAAFYEEFDPSNLIDITADEMVNLVPNLLSVSPELVFIRQGYHRIRSILENHQINVVEIPFDEVAKLGGLLRCVTLPLERTSF